MFEGFTRRRLKLADAEINCVVGGRGPPVLLLHGFPQCLALWARVAPELAARFTVVCADLRGYGDSSKPEQTPDYANYSFRALTDDQVGLMRELGFEAFHLVGHDRGGRTGHRMALDHPEVVKSLVVMDIVPTHAMFMETDRHLAGGYWHWFFLAQPSPFPERLIGADPDYFYERCLIGWGASRLEDFDAEQLAEYRRCWRDPKMIHGSCSDYRAAARVDLEHDGADIHLKVQCPVLAFWGSSGLMHRFFDLGEQWRRRCARLATATLPGGHFFVDQFPKETARVLLEFLESHA
jgi:haloacetate dehalogenase